MGVSHDRTLSFVQGREKVHLGAFGRHMCYRAVVSLMRNCCTGFVSCAQQLLLCGGFYN